MEAPQRKHVASQTVAAIRHNGAYRKIGAIHHKLYQWAHEAGIRPTGPAFTVFLAPPDQVSWDAGEFEVCLPVPSDTPGTAEVPVRQEPASDVLAVVVQGPYREIPAHYAEFLAWLSIDGIEPAGPPREIYLVHPGPDGSGDPKAFRTEIQFPIGPEG